MDNAYLRRHLEELNENSATITPICIVVDISRSMIMYKDNDGLSRMDRLKDGLNVFFQEIRKIDSLADSAEIAVVAFNKDAYRVQEFTPMDGIGSAEDINFPKCNSSGDTPLGVDLALDMLEDEKQFLKKSGKKYNQPWIVIMSDGRATAYYDSETNTRDEEGLRNRMRSVISRLNEQESQDHLTVIPVLISETKDGEYAEGKAEMQNFKMDHRCVEIGSGEEQVSFRKFFRILSRSVSVSNADLLFGKSTAYPALRRSDGRSDARASANVRTQTLRNEPDRAATKITRSPRTASNTRLTQSEPTRVTSFVPSPEPQNTELDEVIRLEKEANQAPVTSTTDQYAREADDAAFLGTVTIKESTPAPTPPVITRVVKKDDKYLESLLAGLTDWDYI